MATPQAVIFDQDDSTTAPSSSTPKAPKQSVQFDQAGKAPDTVHFDAPTAADDKGTTDLSTGGHPENYGFTWENAAKNVSGVLQSAVKLPGQVYHAFADDPTDQEKTEGVQWRKAHPVGPLTQALAPTETSGTKRVGLGLERLIRPGYEQEQKRANEEQNTPTTSNTDLAGHALLSAGHRVASVIPMVGPIAGQLTDQAVSGDVGGALTQAATLYGTGKLIEALPKVAAGVSKGIKVDLPGGAEGRIKIPVIGKVGEIANISSHVSDASDFLASKGKGILQDINESRIGTDTYEAAHKQANFFLKHFGKAPLSDVEFEHLYNHVTYDKAFPELNRRVTPRVPDTSPTPVDRPITAEETAAARPEAPTPTKEENDAKLKSLMEQIAPAEAPIRDPFNVKRPGQVQPETFPQHNAPIPDINQGTTMEMPGGGVRVGKPKLLTDGNPLGRIGGPAEPTPAPSPATAAEMQSLTTDKRGNVIENPNRAVGPLIKQGLAEGSKEAKPVATAPNTLPRVEGTTPRVGAQPAFLEHVVTGSTGGVHSYEYHSDTGEFLVKAVKEDRIHIYDNVSPEQAAAYADQLEGRTGTSKGATWAEIKKNHDQVGKIMKGKREDVLHDAPKERLAVGDTFVDETGEPRRITAIEGDKIRTADGTLRTYEDVVKARGKINSPQARLAQGGKFHPVDEGKPESKSSPLGRIGESDADFAERKAGGYVPRESRASYYNKLSPEEQEALAKKGQSGGSDAKGVAQEAHDFTESYLKQHPELRAEVAPKAVAPQQGPSLDALAEGFLRKNRAMDIAPVKVMGEESRASGGSEKAAAEATLRKLRAQESGKMLPETAKGEPNPAETKSTAENFLKELWSREHGEAGKPGSVGEPFADRTGQSRGTLSLGQKGSSVDIPITRGTKGLEGVDAFIDNLVNSTDTERAGSAESRAAQAGKGDAADTSRTKVSDLTSSLANKYYEIDAEGNLTLKPKYAKQFADQARRWDKINADFKAKNDPLKAAEAAKESAQQARDSEAAIAQMAKERSLARLAGTPYEGEEALQKSEEVRLAKKLAAKSREPEVKAWLKEQRAEAKAKVEATTARESSSIARAAYKRAAEDVPKPKEGLPEGFKWRDKDPEAEAARLKRVADFQKPADVKVSKLQKLKDALMHIRRIPPK